MANFLNKNKFHFLSILILFILSLLLLKPVYFDNKTISTSDKVQASGMAKSASDYLKSHPKAKPPQWNRNLFSGMPNYLITGVYQGKITKYNIVSYLQRFINPIFWQQENCFFIMAVFFYFLAISLGVRSSIALLGSVTFAFASNSSILLLAGHATKLLTICHIPLVFLGFFLIDKKKYILGISVMSLGLMYVNTANHLQLMYYLYIIILFLSLGYAYSLYKAKENVQEIIRNLTAKGLAIILGVGFILFSTLQVQDHSKRTIRVGSILSSKKDENENKKNRGLDKDYAFTWSYGIGESLMLGFPNIYGGASGEMLDKKSETFQFLTNKGVSPNQAEQFVYSLNTYWGDKPFTSGPIYLGVISIFLFIFSLFFLKSKYKYAIIFIMALSLAHAWGKNFSSLNYFLFDYIPFLNKFRDHSMVLSFLQFLIAITAILTLHQLSKEKNKTILDKALKHTLYSVSSLVAFSLLLYIQLSYDAGIKDQQLLQNLTNMTQNRDFANGIMSALKSDRQTLFFNDILKFIFYGGLAYALFWAFINKKLSFQYLILALTLLTTIDLISLSKNYLKEEKFVTQKQISNPITPDIIDKEILKDIGNTYRIFDYSSSNTFSNALPSAFHRNIGGYHPAKLSIYQDLIERHIEKLNPKVLNMLNMKYLILKDKQTGKKKYQINPDALGACWLVDSLIITDNAEEAINTLNTFDEKKTAVLEKQHLTNDLPISDLEVGDFDMIRNIYASPDTMIYSVKTSSNCFAVFSEIYYADEWKATVNGKEVDIQKTNYALRGLFLTPGKSEITFSFNPKYKNYGKYTKLVLGNVIPLIILFILFKPLIMRLRNKNVTSS